MPLQNAGSLPLASCYRSCKLEAWNSESLSQSGQRLMIHFEGNEITVACACMRIGRACNGPTTTLRRYITPI